MFKSVKEKDLEAILVKHWIGIILVMILWALILIPLLLWISFLAYSGIFFVLVFVFNFIAPLIAGIFWATAPVAVFSWAWSLGLWLGMLTYKIIKRIIKWNS